MFTSNFLSFVGGEGGGLPCEKTCVYLTSILLVSDVIEVMYIQSTLFIGVWTSGPGLNLSRPMPLKRA